MPDNLDVSNLQNEFFKRLYKIVPAPEPLVPVLIKNLIEFDNDIIDFSLGSLGQKVKDFALNLDLYHPEIKNIFDGVLADDQDFSKYCIELLWLGKFAKEQNLNKIFPEISQTVLKQSFDSNLIKKIENPQKGKMYVRLLKDCNNRKELRLLKKMQSIDLQIVYKKGKEIWDNQPNSFFSFLRFDKSYENDIKIAEKKLNRYKELGCTSLANEIQKSIDAFNEHIKDCYFGFNRITMTSASIVLAKSLGYRCLNSQDIVTGAENFKIVVDRSFFGKYNFDPNQSDILEYTTSRSSDLFDYEPRIYPLHELIDLASDEVKKTINLLEAFPDCNNKPIFDHFGVIVPSVNFPTCSSNNMFSIRDENGIIQSYSLRYEAIKSLDLILIKGKYFSPIIVGEREGKCYFLSYFT